MSGSGKTTRLRVHPKKGGTRGDFPTHGLVPLQVEEAFEHRSFRYGLCADGTGVFRAVGRTVASRGSRHPLGEVLQDHLLATRPRRDIPSHCPESAPTPSWVTAPPGTWVPPRCTRRVASRRSPGCHNSAHSASAPSRPALPALG